MRNDLDSLPTLVNLPRPKGRRLSPELVEALINVRVCELEVVGAKAAVDYARAQADDAWRDFRSSDTDD